MVDYSYHLYQQFVFGSLDFEPIELIPWYNPDGQGSYIAIRLKNNAVEGDGEGIVTAFRLNPDSNGSEIEMSDFTLTSLPTSLKILTLNDNIVLQSKDSIIIYNMGKSKDLKISNPRSDKTEELRDLYIDAKSKIFIASRHRIMYVSLKKQIFETVYQSEVHSFHKFMVVTEEFCIFENTFGDIVILEWKSKDEFVESKVIPSLTAGMGSIQLSSITHINTAYKLILPEYGIKVYNFSENWDLLLKPRQNHSSKLPIKIIAYLPYSETHWFLYCSMTLNTSVLLYNTKMNMMESKLDFPKDFTLTNEVLKSGYSMAVSTNNSFLILISTLRGEQDLYPDESCSFSSLQYKQNYLNFVQIDKFKVGIDLKPCKQYSLSLVKTVPTEINFITALKDDYFACSMVNNEVSVFEADYDVLEMIQIWHFKLDGGEKEELNKDLTTKLIKEEIEAMNEFGLLTKEEILAIQWIQDKVVSSSSLFDKPTQFLDSSKMFFCLVITNLKIYLLSIEFQHNEFYFLEAEETKEAFKFTYLWGIKLDKPISMAKIIPLKGEKFVVNLGTGEVLQLNISRQLDTYYKNIRYSLYQNVLYKSRHLLDVYNERNDFEWKALWRGYPDFKTIKIVQ
jgi:hypothetical protein